MKFLLTRTSNYNGELEKLNVDSKKYKLTIENFDYIEDSRFKSFEEYKNKIGEDFLAKGTDHKETKDGIQRTFKNYKTGVFIELNSLDELIEFQKDYHDIIIEEPSCNHNILEIEIYDDWRE